MLGDRIPKSDEKRIVYVWMRMGFESAAAIYALDGNKGVCDDDDDDDTVVLVVALKKWLILTLSSAVVIN